MRTTFHHADFEALEAFWNAHAPEEFQLSSSRMKTHWTGCPLFDWGLSAVELEDGKPIAFAIIKRSAASLYRGVDSDIAHLAAFACNECQHGVDLLAQAKRVLRDRGVQRLVFGQDSMHLFPGCPDNWPKLHDFLTVEGFEPKPECFDLVTDLEAFEPICELSDQVRPCRADDLPSLYEFLAREFPGRWHYDLAQKVDTEERVDFVYGLFIGGACEGFAVTQDASHQLPIAGAVFFGPLGNNGCALGPIGVSTAVRRQGWGDRLLASTLGHLKGKGFSRCRVDWTTLTKWYERHGFRVERRYTPMHLNLDQPVGEPFDPIANV